MNEDNPKSFNMYYVKIQDGDNFRFRNSQNKPVIFNSICVHGSLCTCDCAPCTDLEGGRGVSRYTTPPPLLQIRNFMILGIFFSLRINFCRSIFCLSKFLMISLAPPPFQFASDASVYTFLELKMDSSSGILFLYCRRNNKLIYM